MNALATTKTRLTNLTLVAAAVAALGLGALNAGSASAAPTDGPWPEQPSCSNVTFDCTSIEDQLAYECFFVEDSEGIEWCETDLEDMLEITFTPSRPSDFTIGKPTPPPPPPVKSFTVR